MECEHCKTEFTSLSSLNYHKKTAKYCLKLRNINTPEKKFCCDDCKSVFASKQSLDRHKLICLEYILKNTKLTTENKYIQELEKIKNINENKDEIINKLKLQVKYLQTIKNETITKLESQVKEIQTIKNETITKLESQVKDLQDQLASIAMAAASKPSNVNNNNQRINQTINNFTAMTDEFLKEQSKFLTLDHIKDGPHGYAKYALEHPLKNNLNCVDYARKKVKYKNEHGEIVIDPEMCKLTQKIFESIEDRNYNLTQDFLEELQGKLTALYQDPQNNEMNMSEAILFENRCDQILTVIKKINGQNREINDLVRGLKPDMYYGFSKNVCIHTV